MSDTKIGETVCKHNVSTFYSCIECRIDIVLDRIERLKHDKSKVAQYELLMLSGDIKLLSNMLANGRTIL